MNPFGIEPGSNKFLYKTEIAPDDDYYLEVKAFRNGMWHPLMDGGKIRKFDCYLKAVAYINSTVGTPAHYRIVNFQTNQVEETFETREVF